MDIEGAPEIKLNIGKGMTPPKLLPTLERKARYSFSLGAKNGLLSEIKHQEGNHSIAGVLLLSCLLI